MACLNDSSWELLWNNLKCQLDATRYFYWCILSSTCFGYKINLLHQVGISNYFMSKMHGQTTLKFSYIYYSFSPHVPHAPPTSPPLILSPNDIFWGEKITRLVNTQFSSVSYKLHIYEVARPLLPPWKNTSGADLRSSSSRRKPDIAAGSLLCTGHAVWHVVGTPRAD